MELLKLSSSICTVLKCKLILFHIILLFYPDENIQFLIILSLLVIFIQSALLNDVTIADLKIRTAQVETIPVDFETVESAKTAPQAPSPSIEAISNDMAKAAYLEIKPKFNTYNLATTFFNSQIYFGDVCNRCKKLEYFAFRMGKTYLTANAGNLQWIVSASGSPANSQLFIGEQQIDGTWAFKSLTQGKYIRADSNGSTINWQTYVGPWERWCIERHGNHVHVQSAQFQFFYWINSGSILSQYKGGASALIVEHWPAINWLWNW